MLCFTKTTSFDYEIEKSYPSLQKFLRQSQSARPEPAPNRPHNFYINGIILSTSHLLIHTNKNVTSSLTSYNFRLKQSRMTFSTSNDGIQCSLDFDQDLAFLTVKMSSVHEVTISLKKSPPVAWNLLLQQTHDILSHHLVRIPITPTQQVTHAIRDEVFSTVRAQEMNTSGYQVSYMEEIEGHWEDLDLNMYAVFRLAMNYPFSHSNFNVFEIGSVAESLIPLNTEEDKEKSPGPQTTPVSERPNQPLSWWKNAPSVQEVNMFPNIIFELC